ncbi:MAG: hypothetical protein V3V45_06005 [Candidatus Brocadiales bacterium]
MVNAEPYPLESSLRALILPLRARAIIAYSYDFLVTVGFLYVVQEGGEEQE